MMHISSQMLRKTLAILAVGLIASAGLTATCLGGGQFDISVVDRDTKLPIYARMHLKNAQGKSVKPPGAIYWQDHFVVPGHILLKLPKGVYHFELECGLEYLIRSGNFKIDEGADDSQIVDMKRFVDMSKEGWWSADFFVRRPAKDLPDLMLADDLHLVPNIGWWNAKQNPLVGPPDKQPLKLFDKNRCYHTFAGGESRAGGTALIFNLPQPLELPEFAPEYPSIVSTLHRAKQADPHVWIDAPDAYAWDLPLWIAAGKVDSVGIANSHLGRAAMTNAEGPGNRPHDAKAYADARGSARWAEDIYFQLLECGLRIPPSAGSGTGVVANPIGYNRLYVKLDGEFNERNWFEGLRAGRVLVTNGPLIRPDVEGQPPGHVFEFAAGDTHEFEIGLTLSTREKIDYLEIVRDGQVEHHVRLDEFVGKQGKLPPLKFTRSGWFLIRAVTENQTTHRFGETAAYFVQIGDQPRISRQAAQFFIDWIKARAGNIQLESPQREEISNLYAKATNFWQAILVKANAE